MQATPEQVKKSIDEWIAWKNIADKSVKFEFGLPLQAISRISPDEIITSPNPASGHAFIEGEITEIENLLQTHPHLKTEGTTIDLFEMIPIEQM
jgi:hypothetical protein